MEERKLALRRIITVGDDILRKRAREVTKFDDRLASLIDDMFDTMYDAPGAGLAANQVGILRRVVVIDVGDGPVELVNPEIIKVEGEQHTEEGCLSVPGKQGSTTRPAKVTVKAFNRKGEEIEVTGEDLMAVALCHETDHLDGTLYIDHAEETWEVED